MSSRTGTNPRVTAWINAANAAKGWEAEGKIKRAIFKTPEGQTLTMALRPSPEELSRFESRVRNLGLALPDRPATTAPAETPSERPDEIDGLTVEQQALRVWERARMRAIARTVEEQMHDGVLYYVWRLSGLEAFIREVFPSLTEYEPVRGSWGQRPIYDFLRAKGIVFEQGQRADHKPGEHTLLIADVWNVEIVRETTRSAVAAARKEAREAVEREIPEVIRGVGNKLPEPEVPQEPLPQPAGVSGLATAWELFQEELTRAWPRLEGDGDCDYYKADAANQKERAEVAERRLADIREALETLPMAQAFAKIVELVPPVYRR